MINLTDSSYIPFISFMINRTSVGVIFCFSISLIIIIVPTNKAFKKSSSCVRSIDSMSQMHGVMFCNFDAVAFTSPMSDGTQSKPQQFTILSFFSALKLANDRCHKGSS